MLTSILSWSWIGTGILLIILVLLHSPKGDGMGGLAASGSSMFSSASRCRSNIESTDMDVPGSLPVFSRDP